MAKQKVKRSTLLSVLVSQWILNTVFIYVSGWRLTLSGLSLTISSCSSKVSHRVTAQYVISKEFSEHVRFSRSCKNWSEFERIDQCSSKIRIALNEMHLIVQLGFCSRVKKSLLVRSYVALGARILSLIPLRMPVTRNSSRWGAFLVSVSPAVWTTYQLVFWNEKIAPALSSLGYAHSLSLFVDWLSAW